MLKLVDTKNTKNFSQISQTYRLCCCQILCLCSNTIATHLMAVVLKESCRNFFPPLTSSVCLAQQQHIWKLEGVEILISPSDVSAYTVAHQYLPTRILFEIEGAGLKDQRLEPLCAKRLASQAWVVPFYNRRCLPISLYTSRLVRTSSTETSV